MMTAPMMTGSVRRLVTGLRASIAGADPVLLGAFVVALIVRAWGLGQLPPGLNQDEAASAYDAFSIIHHGVDRHGNWLPVLLVSWGSGMNALAAYVAAPLIGLFGLSVWSARLPFLLAGLCALPLFFGLLRDTTSLLTARIGVVLLALSPWHIMISRWGLEANLFPFVFLVAAFLLGRSLQRPRLLIAAALALGLCLYSYGTAYVAVPAFAALTLAYGFRHRLWPPRIILLSATVFVIVAIPIALYVAVNSFGWQSIRTPLFTIPRLTGVPRFKTVGNIGLFSSDFLKQAWANLGAAADLFRTQDDGLIWNALPGYGILFGFSTFLVLAGLALLLGQVTRRALEPAFVLVAWVLAALLLCAFVRPNINRINIAMFPFIFCTAVACALLWRYRALAVLLSLLFVGSFIGFVSNYFGSYGQAVAGPFFASFGEAIRHASAQTQGQVCVTDQVNMPYIFVLFYNQEDPRLFKQTVRISNPGAEFENVTSFGRYTFGLSSCADVAPVLIATHDEAGLFPADRFARRDFERYTVLVRRP